MRGLLDHLPNASGEIFRPRGTDAASGGHSHRSLGCKKFRDEVPTFLLRADSPEDAASADDVCPFEDVHNSLRAGLVFCVDVQSAGVVPLGVWKFLGPVKHLISADEDVPHAHPSGKEGYAAGRGDIHQVTFSREGFALRQVVHGRAVNDEIRPGVLHDVLDLIIVGDIATKLGVGSYVMTIEQELTLQVRSELA